MPAGHGDPGDERRRRAAIRRFIRENHPDRGGDPEAFDAGLRALREGGAARTGAAAATATATAATGAPAGRGGTTAYRKRGTGTLVTDWVGRAIRIRPATRAWAAIRTRERHGRRATRTPRVQ